MGKKGGGDKWVRLIGLIKLLKGVLLLALACGAFKLLHRNLAEELSGWTERLNMDPNNQVFQKVVGKLGSMDSHKLLLYTVGTLFYSALFLIEGIGLLLLKHWAEYFAVIITASFLPIEGYELIKKFTGFKLVVIALNAAIVIYLIVRLKRGKGRAAAK
jgi:uncharacterized membrane protein (DUF2068 family)